MEQLPTFASLSTLTWPDVARRRDRGDRLLLCVPVGSCEQHGPHLPFDVDSVIAEAVARGVASCEDVVLGPTLSYGASGEHEGFAGTISIGTEVLVSVLIEIARSASRWASRLLLVSGHGGNVEALISATERIRSEGRNAAWWACALPHATGHAGRTETSLMMAIHPIAVRTADARAGELQSVEQLMPILRRQGVIGISSNGVLGDPSGASAQEGYELVHRLVDRLRIDLDRWIIADDGRLKSPEGWLSGLAEADESGSATAETSTVVEVART